MDMKYGLKITTPGEFNIYRPQGKVMFSQASVSSRGGGGGRVSLVPCPFWGVGYPVGVGYPKGAVGYLGEYCIHRGVGIPEGRVSGGRVCRDRVPGGGAGYTQGVGYTRVVDYRGGRVSRRLWYNLPPTPPPTPRNGGHCRGWYASY